MSSYLINVKIDTHVQGDGTLLATSDQLPIFVAAKDSRELSQRVREALNAVALYLESFSDEAEAFAYLKENGVSVDRKGEGDHMEVPVLVGA